MGDPGPFRTPQVAQLVGVTTRKIISFADRGYVTPSVQQAAGHGSKRLWSYCDVIKCAAVYDLLTLLTAAHVQDLARGMFPDSAIGPDQAWYVVPSRYPKDDTRIIPVPSANPYERLEERVRQFESFHEEKRRTVAVGLFINFAEIHKRVRQSISELQMEGAART